MAELRRMLVNPRKVNGKPLKVFNERGQILAWTDKGTSVPKKAYYNRLLKTDDIVEVKKQVKEPKQAVSKKDKKIKPNKVEE